VVDDFEDEEEAQIRHSTVEPLVLEEAAKGHRFTASGFGAADADVVSACQVGPVTFLQSCMLQFDTCLVAGMPCSVFTNNFEYVLHMLFAMYARQPHYNECMSKGFYPKCLVRLADMGKPAHEARKYESMVLEFVCRKCCEVVMMAHSEAINVSNSATINWRCIECFQAHSEKKAKKVARSHKSVLTKSLGNDQEEAQ
jgi:hypothetical protein